MSSKHAANRPKYTPPKVCKKSETGPTWRYVDGQGGYIPAAFQIWGEVSILSALPDTKQQIKFAYKARMVDAGRTWSGEINTPWFLFSGFAVERDPALHYWTVIVTFVDMAGITVTLNPNTQPSNFQTHPWLRYNPSWLETDNPNGLEVLSLSIDQATP